MLLRAKQTSVLLTFAAFPSPVWIRILQAHSALGVRTNRTERQREVYLIMITAPNLKVTKRNCPNDRCLCKNPWR